KPHVYTDAGVRCQCEARFAFSGMQPVEIACVPGGAITYAGALRRIPAARRTPSVLGNFSTLFGRKRDVCSDSCIGPATSAHGANSAAAVFPQNSTGLLKAASLTNSEPESPFLHL